MNFGPKGHLVELDGAQLPTQPTVFDLLQKDAIVVIRGLPEIHELGATLRRLALSCGASIAELQELMLSGQISGLQTLSAFHAAFRHLRDSRYLSCLFSDVIASFGLPHPVLIDTGFCRMVVPDLADKAAKAPDLFKPPPFECEGVGEAEPMLQGGSWGNAHRDLDARHYHYQVNLWFPLHDLAQERSLLLFPEAYRRDIPQYGPLADPDNPDGWGFGPALRVPLKFGDTLVFHSQHLHASPAFMRGQSRFTVEIRAAGGCIDDNTRIYRRLFWNLDNFRARKGEALSAPQRAAQLSEQALETLSSGDALLAQTAHTLIHRLFQHSSASLAAGYVRRAPDVLDDVIKLDDDAAQRLLAALEALPSGEDLQLLAARILWHQGHGRHATTVIERVCALSASYFWALEAGRVAAEFGAFDVAALAFMRAERLAAESSISLDRYTPGLAPPRIPGWVPQLLPRAAQRASKALARRARSHRPGAHRSAEAFDYQGFLRPWWKRLIRPLLRSKRPHTGLMPFLVTCTWHLRRLRSIVWGTVRS